MTEEELLYHFPYKIDKELSFRHFAKNDKAFVRRYVPTYDGTNVGEFITNKTSLTATEINEFDYIYENFRRWTNWYNNGRNIFSFSKDLLAMLDKTDVSDVKPDSFHLPYDIFYISLKALNIKVSKDSDAIIEGVYIDHNIWNFNGEHPEGYCDLSFYFVGDFKEIYLKYLPNVKSSLQPFTNSDEYEETPLGSFWNVYLWFQKSEKRETVKEAVDYFITSLKEEIFINNKTAEQVSDFDLDFYNSTIKLLDNTLNLVVNCLLYLSQPKERKDIEFKLPNGLPGNLDKKLSFAKTPKDIKKVEDTFSQLGFTKIYYVGQSFKRTHQQMLSGVTLQTHWRRGHWRNQKFGENLNQSKMIWILPTIVNSDKGEPTKGHLYDLQDRTTNR